MAAISGWGQAAGLFWRWDGANRGDVELMRRRPSWVSHRGPEREPSWGRARRSGIIRSLCGPLKRLQRKPADEFSAPRYLGESDEQTHNLRGGHQESRCSGHKCKWAWEQTVSLLYFHICKAFFGYCWMEINTLTVALCDSFFFN